MVQRSVLTAAKELAGLLERSGVDRGSYTTSAGSPSVRYGTVQAVNADGSVTVLLDGSGEPVTLPASSTAGKSLKAGDRVKVAMQGNRWVLDLASVVMNMRVESDRLVLEFEGVKDKVDALDKAVASVDVEYALGDSPTEAPASGWQAGAPAWQEGKYIWQRTRTVFTDGTEAVSDPTCIQGTSGKDGVSPTEITEQYYLSTSKYSQQGGSWSTSQPEWQEGRYIWTRNKVTWSNGSITYTSPVLAAAINGANQAALDGSKTATNFIEASSSGITVADMRNGAPQSKVVVGSSAIGFWSSLSEIMSLSMAGQTSMIQGKGRGLAIYSLAGWPLMLGTGSQSEGQLRIGTSGDNVQVFTDEGDFTFNSRSVCAGAATARMADDASATLTSTMRKIPLTELTGSVGSGMSLSGSGIRVRSAGRVLVGGYAYFEGAAAGTNLVLSICKNIVDGPESQWAISTTVADMGTVAIPPIAMEVAAQDTIYLCARRGQSGRAVVGNGSDASQKAALTVQYI